jgi:hypothetical protein
MKKAISGGNSLFDKDGRLITSATVEMKKTATSTKQKLSNKKPKTNKKAKAQQKTKKLKAKQKIKVKKCRETGCDKKVKSPGAKYCWNHHIRPNFYSD